MDNDTSANDQENAQDQPDSTYTELEALKTRALNALLPLVDKINEPPQRKFEILMTAARSSGDPKLLSKALEVAQQIDGDTPQADAVLDVLNEINLNINNG